MHCLGVKKEKEEKRPGSIEETTGSKAGAIGEGEGRAN